jgi:hypothetical protein
MILPGFTSSSLVSILIELNGSQSTIALSFFYQLQLVPLFDCFGYYVCEPPFPSQHVKPLYVPCNVEIMYC